MIKLTRIVEQYGAEGQFYDIGQDFSAFRRMIDGADQQLKQEYEKKIAAKLVGKRVRARASRGYKQFVKDYEFDVTKVTLDDYYDNFVVVAYDSTTPKPKEYFLKTGFKVQILGPSTGQPSPQKGGDPRFEKPKAAGPTTIQPGQNPNVAQSQPMALAPAGKTPSETGAMEEDKKIEGEGLYDAYGMDEISQDIKRWMPKLLKKPETQLREFIKGLGWKKNLDNKTTVALFDLRIPSNMVKPHNNEQTIRDMLAQESANPKPGEKMGTRYELVKCEPDQQKGEWTVRIKKVISQV